MEQVVSINIITMIYVLLIPLLYFGLKWGKKITYSLWPLQHKEYLYWFEVGVWSIYILFFVNHLWQHNKLLAVMIAILPAGGLLWYVFFGLKDFIAGLILCKENRLSKNDIIVLNDGTEGIVAECRRRTLVLETLQGTTLLVPYSQLMNYFEKRKTASDALGKHVFFVQLAANENCRKYITELNAYIISLPWAPPSKLSQVAVHEQTPQYCKLKITLYAVDEHYLEVMQNEIEQFVEKWQ